MKIELTENDCTLCTLCTKNVRYNRHQELGR